MTARGRLSAPSWARPVPLVVSVSGRVRIGPEHARPRALPGGEGVVVVQDVPESVSSGIAAMVLHETVRGRMVDTTGNARVTWAALVRRGHGSFARVLSFEHSQ